MQAWIPLSGIVKPREILDEVDLEKTWDDAHAERTESFSYFQLTPSSPETKSKYLAYKVKEMYPISIFIVLAIMFFFYSALAASSIFYRAPRLENIAIIAWCTVVISLFPGWFILYIIIKKKNSPSFDERRHFPFMSIYSICDKFIFIHSVCVCTCMLVRVLVGKCASDHPPGPARWSCNPTAASQSLAEVHMFLMIMTLPILQVIFKCHNFVVLACSWAATYTLFGVCLIVAEAKFSYPMSAVMFLPGIVSYDYERQVLRGFFSKENFGASLQKAANLESEKRLADLSIKEMQHVIGNIAHDLKTPMQGICMGLDHSTQLVASQLNSARLSRAAPSQDQNSSGEVYQTLETLKDTAGFMVLSINRALDFSKASRDIALVPTLENTDLIDTVQWTVGCVDRLQSTVSIIVDPFSFAIQSHPRVSTDKGWFTDNILSLLSNAVKFAEKEVHLSVTVEEQREGESTRIQKHSKIVPTLQIIKVCVMDDGPNIPEERKDSLFTPSIQYKRMEGGAGLGLYCLSKRVEALGGSCGVKDRADGISGSCFWFSFPYVLSESARILSSEHLPVTSRPAVQNSVLIVDDAVVVQKTLRRSLEKQGFEVSVANNGLDGLNKIKESHYDVVLLDINMPVMDGYGCSKGVREHEGVCHTRGLFTPRQLIIGISANTDGETRERAIEAGMDAFIEKPFSMEVFMDLYKLFSSEGTSSTNN